MDIPVQTNLIGYTRQVVAILSFFYQITDKEKELLSKLLLVYLKNIEHPNKEKLTFDQNTLKLIRGSMKMKLQSFNNHKMQLRFKKVLMFNGNKETVFSPTIKNLLPKTKEELKNNNFNFKFTVNE